MRFLIWLCVLCGLANAGSTRRVPLRLSPAAPRSPRLGNNVRALPMGAQRGQRRSLPRGANQYGEIDE